MQEVTALAIEEYGEDAAEVVDLWPKEECGPPIAGSYEASPSGPLGRKT